VEHDILARLVDRAIARTSECWVRGCECNHAWRPGRAWRPPTSLEGCIALAGPAFPRLLASVRHCGALTQETRDAWCSILGRRIAPPALQAARPPPMLCRSSSTCAGSLGQHSRQHMQVHAACGPASTSSRCQAGSAPSARRRAPPPRGGLPTPPGRQHPRPRRAALLPPVSARGTGNSGSTGEDSDLGDGGTSSPVTVEVIMVPHDAQQQADATAELAYYKSDKRASGGVMTPPLSSAHPGSRPWQRAALGSSGRRIAAAPRPAMPTAATDGPPPARCTPCAALLSQTAPVATSSPPCLSHCRRAGPGVQAPMIW